MAVLLINSLFMVMNCKDGGGCSSLYVYQKQ